MKATHETMADDDIKSLAATAQEHYKQKNFEPAHQAFGVLRLIRPDNAHWADRYAHCEMLLKRFPEAQLAWTETIARHGPTLFRVTHCARCFIETRHYQSARNCLALAHSKIEPNASFFIFVSVSALALGDRDSALRSAMSIEETAGEKSEDSVNYLCALLRRLVNDGRGEDVLWLADSLLASFKAQEKLLRLGFFASAALALFEKRLFYASGLWRLYPDDIRENIAYLRALIDAQRLDKAIAHARHLDTKFPKLDRAPLDDRVLDSLQNVLHALPKWQSVLRVSNEPETFSSINLRLAALVTFKAYREAANVAELALSTHAEHPWFMSILATAHDKMGKMDGAAEWLAKAVERAPDMISFLIQLADIQIRAGKLTQAAESVGKLAASHPRLPATLALMGRLGQGPPISGDGLSQSARIAGRQRETWLHGGDSGDIIYALAAMKGGGGGGLFLTSICGTREPMTVEKIAFLTPLLEVQSYVDRVAAWQGQPITRDFNVFRHHPVPDKDLATQQWHSVLQNGEPDIKTPWLAIPPRRKHGRPVFARSPRYRNPGWDPIWLELKKSSPDAIFVGTVDEFEAFGHGEHYLARDALDLAQIIYGASIFVGNQSLPYAIAEGLKVGRMLEVYQATPNCVFPGALALSFRGKASLR